MTKEITTTEWELIRSIRNYRNAYPNGERMMKLEGKQNAEILSSHPSSQNRIEELRRFLLEAMKYYKK